MRKTTLVVPFAASVAALIGTAIAGMPASGLDSAATFTLLEHQTEFGAIAQHGPASTVDDSFALSSDLYADSNMTTLVGHAGVSCIQTSITRGAAGEVECSWTTVLTGGQITATGIVDLASATTAGAVFTMPVVGGTGRYRNAHGEVAVKVINGTDSWDTWTLT